MIELELWQKIGLYALLLGSLYIYVKLSNLKVNGAPFLRLEYRILIAVLFPLILIAAILIGSVLLAAALVALALITVYSLVTKKKIKINFRRITPKDPLS